MTEISTGVATAQMPHTAQHADVAPDPEPEQRESILIVDDEPGCRNILSISLGQAGYACEVAENAPLALERLEAGSFDLMITDIQMPGMDGLELFAKLREFDQSIGVVMITGHATFDTALTALKLGASDYVSKPFNLDEVVITAERALERRRLMLQNERYQKELEDHKRQLEEQVQERTGQLKRALENLEEAYSKTKQANRDTVFVLSKAAETNDEDTGMHIKRVGEFAAAIAREIGLDANTIEKLNYSSELHDVGKVATHPDILRKPGKLTDDEFVEMRKHTSRGAQILEEVGFLDMAKEIALCHHEKFDGSGYPERLEGEQIPLCARITAIVDVFDALTTKRCYRDAMPVEKALDIIGSEKGKHFDPEVHEAFYAVLPKIEELRRHFADE